MKPLFSILFLFIFSIHIVAQSKPNQNFELSGNIKDWEGKYIYFTHSAMGKTRSWDSTLVKNNKFSFQGSIAQPVVGYLSISEKERFKSKNEDKITDELYLTPSKMKIDLKINEFKTAKLKGSKVHNEYLSLEKKKKKYNDKMEPYSKEYVRLNNEYIAAAKLPNAEEVRNELSAKMYKIKDDMEPFRKASNDIDLAFFKNNPNSYITLRFLRYYYSSHSLDELKNYYNKLTPTTKKWDVAKELQDEITTLSNSSKGSMAPEFGGIDINGDSLSLRQFRGKYVLLDFWASWCKPCRQGNPALIKLHNTYSSKGFEIIGLADDNKQEDKWKAAVEKDKIQIWKHILDFNIGELYGIHTIPLQVLIDPNGKILARFGDGGESHDNIEKYLAEIFIKK